MNVKQKVDIGTNRMCEFDISSCRQRVDLKFECVIFKIEKAKVNRKVLSHEMSHSHIFYPKFVSQLN